MRFTIILGLILLLFQLPASAASVAPHAAPWNIPDTPFSCEIVGQPVFGSLDAGKQVGYSVNLSPGYYMIIGWASWDIVSLGLKVMDESGNELSRDDGADNFPVVKINLRESGLVRMVYTAGAERITGTAADFSFVIVKEWDCVRRTGSGVKEILDAWTKVAWDERCDIIFWDTMEFSGLDSVFFTRTLSPGTYTVSVETTVSTDDIDLYVRTSGGTILSQDEFPNNFPVCTFKLDRETEIKIEIDPWTFGGGSPSQAVVIIAKER